MKLSLNSSVNRVLLVVLFSLFCCQSMARVPDPTRFEQDIIKFEQQDAVAMPAPNAIVLTGSSSIARWNNQSHAALAPLTVIPRGFGGSNMNDLLHYLDRIVIKYKPRAVLIYEGDNDTALKPPIPKTVILQQLKQIIQKVNEALPETRIYVLSVKPSIARQSVWPLAQDVSAGFKELANSYPLVYYVDVATPLLQTNGKVKQDIFIDDMLHLNDKGNQIWGQTIKAALMPIEAQHE